MKTTTKRARKGGEFGANGEWYEGGKFINTVPENAKRFGSAPKGTRKCEIAPYVWEVQPTPNHHSLFRMVAGIFGKLNSDGVIVPAFNDAILAYTGSTAEEALDLIRRWNDGERWIVR